MVTNKETGRAVKVKLTTKCILEKLLWRKWNIEQKLTANQKPTC